MEHGESEKPRVLVERWIDLGSYGLERIDAAFSGGYLEFSSGENLRRKVTIPVFPVRILSVSAVSAGITFAVGKVFVQHFESGGTFLTFDPEKVREYFAREFRKGVTPTEPNNTTEDSEEDYGGIMP